MNQNNNISEITIINHSALRQRGLPQEIKEELERFSKIHTLGARMPSAQTSSEDIEVHSYDDLLSDEDAPGRFSKVAAFMLAEGQTDPLLLLVGDGDAGKPEVCAELFRAASAGRCRLRVLDSNGPLGVLLLAAGLELNSWFSVADASQVAGAHHPPFPPNAPVLFPDLKDGLTVGRMKPVLLSVYPPDHLVRIVVPGRDAVLLVRDLTLGDMEGAGEMFAGAALILPPLDPARSFEAFEEIIAHLRAPEGCPWDREQDHLTLRRNLLEETYEALDALDRQDIDGMREEFGDLLLQIVLHARIAYEAGEFRMGDILEGIHRKLVHRHPHVFGEEAVSGVKKVLQNWEKLKEEERAAKGQAEKGQLDGVPVSLPALNQAQEIQSRAARVGFDWDEIKPVLEKVFEEIEEIKSARTPEEREKEIGDLLFAVVNLARWHKVDAESALRATNYKFRTRFAYIEKQARAQGKRLADMNLQEMDALWEEAKGMEN